MFKDIQKIQGLIGKGAALADALSKAQSADSDKNGIADIEDAKVLIPQAIKEAQALRATLSKLAKLTGGAFAETAPDIAKLLAEADTDDETEIA